MGVMFASICAMLMMAAKWVTVGQGGRDMLLIRQTLAIAIMLIVRSFAEELIARAH